MYKPGAFLWLTSATSAVVVGVDYCSLFVSKRYGSHQPYRRLNVIKHVEYLPLFRPSTLGMRSIAPDLISPAPGSSLVGGEEVCVCDRGGASVSVVERGIFRVTSRKFPGKRLERDCELFGHHRRVP